MKFFKVKDEVIMMDVEFINEIENDKFLAVEEVAPEALAGYDGTVYYLYKNQLEDGLRSFRVTNKSFIKNPADSLSLLDDGDTWKDYPEFVDKAITEGRIKGINMDFEGWSELMKLNPAKKWKINVLGLGDVGGIMLIGLRLLGGHVIDEIGIYDLDDNKIKRWVYELNQVNSLEQRDFPKVKGITAEELFDGDMFVFCASKAIPPVGSGVKDVRMVQLEGNSKIINIYAKMASEKQFKGIFAVVSDPVDLLCRSAYENGEELIPDQIKGFGLGVMNARAVFYSQEDQLAPHYEADGRAFGPHGKHLIIADSMSSYDKDVSLELTNKTITANLDIRGFGFKPYIAPALSSAAMSLIDMIGGKWHYSTVALNGVFFGCKNRMTPYGQEIEYNKVDKRLMERLEHTYEELRRFNGNL